MWRFEELETVDKRHLDMYQLYSPQNLTHIEFFYVDDCVLVSKLKLNRLVLDIKQNIAAECILSHGQIIFSPFMINQNLNVYT